MLILTRAEVAQLLDLSDCIDAVERAFIQHARGELPTAPGVLGAHVPGGGYHVKTAALGGEPGYFAAKINANFPDNYNTRGLPTIQGVIALFDLLSGLPLAILDSIEITILRTAAASAVAARRLARVDASHVTICGCGVQGRSHLRALAIVRPLTHAYAIDADPARAATFAAELSTQLGFGITPNVDLSRAVADSDLCVTSTPSHQPIFHTGLLKPGLFIAAVGADNPEKQEIDPAASPRARSSSIFWTRRRALAICITRSTLVSCASPTCTPSWDKYWPACVQGARRKTKRSYSIARARRCRMSRRRHWPMNEPFVREAEPLWR